MIIAFALLLLRGAGGGVRGEEKESALVRARDGETRCLRGGCVFGREGEKEGRERRDVK